MSGDKDIENQLEAMEPEAGSDDFSEDSFSESVDNEYAMEEDYTGEDDFGGEEEWDSYEGDEFGDEFDADKAAKSKKFNQIIIGATVVIAMGVGGYTMFSGGAPAPAPTADQQQTSAVAEFQADVKTGDSNPYGIPYGEPVPQDELPPESLNTARGMFNNPTDLESVREGQGKTIDYTQVEDTSMVDGVARNAPVPEPVMGQPPMPAPISTSMGDDQGPLTPMPTSNKSLSDFQKPSDMSGQDGRLTDVSRDRSDSPFANTYEDDYGAPDQMPRMPSQPPSQQTAQSITDPFSGEDMAPMQDDPGMAAMGMGADDTMNTAETDPFADTADTPSRPSANMGTQMDSSELNMIRGKLDDILTRLDDVEDSMARLSALEKKVSALEGKPRSTSKASTSRSSKATTSSSRSTPKRSSIRWVLKSAQPGQAMISKAGESDMVRVSTGQSLAGIGRVTSISVEEGKWVVRGTNGKISQ